MLSSEALSFPAKQPEIMQDAAAQSWVLKLMPGCAGKRVLPQWGGPCGMGMGDSWDDCGDIWLLVPFCWVHSHRAVLLEANTSLWACAGSPSLQNGTIKTDCFLVHLQSRHVAGCFSWGGCHQGKVVAEPEMLCRYSTR